CLFGEVVFLLVSLPPLRFFGLFLFFCVFFLFGFVVIFFVVVGGVFGVGVGVVGCVVGLAFRLSRFLPPPPLSL
ncbi:hypothetical protein, partial [Mesorhizobium japonicum]|uniref:hypothetical protein n=1 Tax=Mesorhizobium japonicum TaxID=2066070 RepID=UPI003B5CFA7D